MDRATRAKGETVFCCKNNVAAFQNSPVQQEGIGFDIHPCAGSGSYALATYQQAFRFPGIQNGGIQENLRGRLWIIANRDSRQAANVDRCALAPGGSGLHLTEKGKGAFAVDGK